MKDTCNFLIITGMMTDDVKLDDEKDEAIVAIWNTPQFGIHIFISSPNFQRIRSLPYPKYSY